MRQIPLTERQLDTYRAILFYLGEYGVIPSYRQIGAMVGLTSMASVHLRLRRMAERGAIEIPEWKLGTHARGIKLIPLSYLFDAKKCSCSLKSEENAIRPFESGTTTPTRAK